MNSLASNSVRSSFVLSCDNNLATVTLLIFVDGCILYWTASDLWRFCRVAVRNRKKNYVVSWRDKALANHVDASCLENTQKEADTKMMLHAVNIAARGFKKLDIYSSDADVLVLVLRRYPLLPTESRLVVGLGSNIRYLNLQKIYQELGPLKASALPGFHALSGADVTGAFFGKGKISWWKAFNKTTDDILQALASLGSSPVVSEELMQTIEQFVCEVYLPDTKITNIGELRWWLFAKNNYKVRCFHQREDLCIMPSCVLNCRLFNGN